jgi:hypothetical protein
VLLLLLLSTLFDTRKEWNIGLRKASCIYRTTTATWSNNNQQTTNKYRVDITARTGRVTAWTAAASMHLHPTTTISPAHYQQQQQQQLSTLNNDNDNNNNNNNIIPTHDGGDCRDGDSSDCNRSQTTADTTPSPSPSPFLPAVACCCCYNRCKRAQAQAERVHVIRLSIDDCYFLHSNNNNKQQTTNK